MASTTQLSIHARTNVNVLNGDGCAMKYKNTTDKKTVILVQPASICMYSNKTIFKDFKEIELKVDSCFSINILGQKETTDTPKLLYKIKEFLTQINPIDKNIVVGFIYYSSNHSFRTYIMKLKDGILTTQPNFDNTEVNVLIELCDCPNTNTKSVGGGSKRKHKKSRIHKPLNRKKRTYKSKQHNRLHR